MKRLVAFLLFLVLCEDKDANYADPSRLGMPFGWVRTVLTEPLPIKIGPFDLILLGVLLWSTSKKDPKGPLVQPMKTAMFSLLGITVVCFVLGLYHGGDVRHASWQTYLILSTMLFAFTVASLFRTAADYVMLGKWLLGVAVYRAGMCWLSYLTWGRLTVGEAGMFLTSHDDTICWVVGIMALIVNAIDRARLLVTVRNLAMILFFLGAIQFNSRRLAWVSLGMGIIALYALFPKGKAKRRVNRAAMVMVPLLLLYVIVGWGKTSGIFLPLKSFATVSTQEDASTLARNAENLGLIATANSFGSLLGGGWGKPYICLTMKYDISASFELWQYVPHNSILGLLAFTGIIGASIFWLMVATSVFLNVRVVRLTDDPIARTVCLIGASQIVVCGNQLYGDMGIFFFKPMYFLAISYAMALRLPKVTGVFGAAPAKAQSPGPSSASAQPIPR